MFIWDFVANPIMDALLDWFYSQIVGFLGAFFAQMGNMGVELFELEWVQMVVLFFSRLGWALYGVSLVVSGFECGIEYASGRGGNIPQAAMDALKGFLAVNLFTTVPLRLYTLAVSLQGTFSAGITGAGSGIGDLGAAILENMESTSLTEIAASGRWGIGTNPLMLLFCIILMEERMKHLCAPIPASLHVRVREGQESSGKTLGQYMTWLLTKFYEDERGVSMSMTDKRTVAFQVPTELFEQFKAYLEKHNIKQNAFFLDCIQRALADDQEG